MLFGEMYLSNLDKRLKVNRSFNQLFSGLQANMIEGCRQSIRRKKCGAHSSASLSYDFIWPPLLKKNHRELCQDPKTVPEIKDSEAHRSLKRQIKLALTTLDHKGNMLHLEMPVTKNYSVSYYHHHQYHCHNFETWQSGYGLKNRKNEIITTF